MLTARFITCLNTVKKCNVVCGNILNRKCSKGRKASKEDVDCNVVTNIESKYKLFKDEDAEIILDIYEEKLKHINEEEDEELINVFKGLNLMRGLNGVFDIEELVEVLNRENVEDIFVASVPEEINYVDHICVVTAKSHRHMKAITEFVRTVYKQKRSKRDTIPKVEGENSKDWMAMDLGNIALHIFSREARKLYDLDSLWSLGPKYDKEYNKEDPIVAMLEKHSIYLKDLKPAT